MKRKAVLRLVKLSLPLASVLYASSTSIVIHQDKQWKSDLNKSISLLNKRILSGEDISTYKTVYSDNKAPTIISESFNVTEDIAQKLMIEATDPNNDPLVFAIARKPAHGSIFVNGQEVIYTGEPDYNGEDLVYLKAFDGELYSPAKAIHINLAAVNDAPIANAITEKTKEDTEKDITLTGSDVDGDPIEYIITKNPQHGSLTGDAPNITYQPEANFNGLDYFTFKTSDGELSSQEKRVTITVLPQNDAPVAKPQSVETNEDTSKTIDLEATDIDSGTVLSYHIDRSPSHGTVSVMGNKVFYKPADNFHGQDTFTFHANDGLENSNTATVTVTVKSVNDNPTTSNKNVVIYEDDTINIDLPAHDIDGDNLVYSIETNPSHGTVTINNSKAFYKPNDDYYGTDVFHFKVYDGAVYSNSSRVSITIKPVNDAPVLQNFSINTNEDVNKMVSIPHSDTENDHLTFKVVESPDHGTLYLAGDQVRYDPEDNFYGADSFKVQANDGRDDSNVATASVTVNSVNDAPTAESVAISTNEDTDKTFTIPASDVEGDPISYIITKQPINGTVEHSGDSFTYSPAEDYFGFDSFKFKVSDGDKSSSEKTVMINVISQNDIPVANDQEETLKEDESKEIFLTGYDKDGDNLVFTIVKDPKHGKITLNGYSTIYTPNLNFNGTDSFTFKASDGKDSSSVATATLTVDPVNDAPHTSNTSANTNEDNQVVFTLPGSDIEGSALTYTIDTPPSHGSVTVSGNKVTYKPNKDYHGTDTFRFKASDGELSSNISTATVHVASVNDNPTAQNVSVETDEDTSKIITLTGEDTEGGVTFIITEPPAHGTVTLIRNKASYKPEKDYNGPDSFKFKAKDSEGALSEEKTATITVKSVNDIPSASNVSVATPEDTEKTITLSGSDVEGPVSFIITENPVHGEVTISGDKATYKPAGNYNGADYFKFKAKDSNGALSEEKTANINITAVNDRPTAENISVTTDEDTPKVIPLTGSDVEGPVTFVITKTPSHGTVTVSGNKATYHPASNYNGTDSFKFKSKDSSGVYSDEKTASITITSVNDAPQTRSIGTLATNEDTSKSATMSGSDVDGTITAYEAVAVSHCRVSASGSTVTIDPDTNFNGTAQFKFRVKDNNDAWSSYRTVNVKVNPINDTPYTNSPGDIETNEDTAKTVTLSGGDVDGSIVAYEAVALSHCTVSNIGSETTIHPESNYNGTAQFKFRVKDNNGAWSSYRTVNIKVNAVNDIPTASNASATTDEDNSKVITLTGSDVEGPVTFVITKNPAHGTVTISGNKATYKPNANYHGTDSFKFKAKDADGALSPERTASIAVNSVNDAPHTNSIEKPVTNEDTAKSVTMSGSDPDGTIVSYEATAISHCSVSTSGSTVTIHPSHNYNGTAQFKFRVKDNSGAWSPYRTVDVTVNAVNDAPTASNVSATTAEDTTKVITLTGSDVEGAVSFVVTKNPAHGTVTISGNKATYKPNANYHGTDSFKFKAKDADGALSPERTASITVTSVNDAPTASDVSATTNEDTTKIITLNGSDTEGSVSFIVTKSPAHGTVTISGNKATYKPNANYHGSDSFKFKAKDSDGALSPERTASITVKSINDAPYTNSLGTPSTNEDTAKTVTMSGGDVDGTISAYEAVAVSHCSVSTSGSSVTVTPDHNYNGTAQFKFRVKDNNGAWSGYRTVNVKVNAVNDAPTASNVSATTAEDTTKVITLPGSDAEGPVTFVITKNPTHGTVTISGNKATYKPNANYHGSDSFKFKSKDNNGAYSPERTASITVTSVNDAPHTNSIGTPETNEDTAKSVAMSGTDPDGTIVAYQASAVSHCSVSTSGSSVTITPDHNYNGTAQFKFRVKDNSGAWSSYRTVNVTVKSVNDAPYTNSIGTLATNEDTAKTATMSGGDVDGSITAYEAVAVSHCSVTTSGSSVTVHPDHNYNGTAQFKFRVKDNSGAWSSYRTVNVNVNAVNDAPTANNVSATTAEDTTKVITLPGSDAEGQVTFVITRNPAHGTVTVSGNKATYKPNANYHGSDSFKFKSKDSNGALSPERTASITVTSVNDAPYTNSIGTLATNEDTAKTATMSGGDVDGSITAYEAVAVSHCSVSTSGSSVTITPDHNYNGTAQFKFRVKDNSGVWSSYRTVNVTVNPVNDGPTAGGLGGESSISTPEDTAKNFTMTGSDPDGSIAAYQAVAVSHCSVSTSGSTVTIHPEANYNGIAKFKYRVKDNSGAWSPYVEITVDVTPVNDAPYTDNIGSFSVNEDYFKQITLSGGDIDGTISAYEAVAVSHCTIQSIDNNKVTIKPEHNYNGTAQFKFRVKDNSGAWSGYRTVNININAVNDAPVLSSVNIPNPINEDQPLIFNLSASDAESDPITYNAKSISHCSVSISGNTLTVIPEKDFNNGEEVFEFWATDSKGADSNRNRRYIHLNPVNDKPRAQNFSISMDEDQYRNFELQGSDPEGDPIEYIITKLPEHGYLYFKDNVNHRTTRVTNTNTRYNQPTFLYDSFHNYNGSDNFKYVAVDSNGYAGDTTKTVSISVLPVNDAPYIYTDKSSVTINHSQQSTWTDQPENTVKLTASDPDGNEGTRFNSRDAYKIIGTSSNIEAATSTLGDHIAVRLKVKSDNTSETGWFDVAVTDSYGAQSATKRVLVSIEGVPDIPTVVNSTINVDSDFRFHVDVADFIDIKTLAGIQARGYLTYSIVRKFTPSIENEEVRNDGVLNFKWRADTKRITTVTLVIEVKSETGHTKEITVNISPSNTQEACDSPFHFSTVKKDDGSIICRAEASAYNLSLEHSYWNTGNFSSSLPVTSTTRSDHASAQLHSSYIEGDDIVKIVAVMNKYNSSNIDPYLYLWADNTFLSSNDDGNGNLNSKIIYKSDYYGGISGDFLYFGTSTYSSRVPDTSKSDYEYAYWLYNCPGTSYSPTVDRCYKNTDLRPETIGSDATYTFDSSTNLTTYFEPVLCPEIENYTVLPTHRFCAYKYTPPLN